MADIFSVLNTSGPRINKGKRRRRTNPVKRWLFTHPSHLKWWYSKNVEKNLTHKNLITGLIVAYDEQTQKVKDVPVDSEQHHTKWKDFAESMGWDIIPCLRFSHSKKNRKPRSWLFNPKTHEAIIKKANKWGSIALDMEPYGYGWQGYHRQSEELELDKAAKVWESCSVPVAIYPSLRTAPEIILSNCYTNRRILLDHTTYNFQKIKDIRQAITDRHHCFVQTRLLGQFWTGLFLSYLNDKSAMNKINKIVTNLWFFPRAKDDRRNFFTPKWHPVK